MIKATRRLGARIFPCNSNSAFFYPTQPNQDFERWCVNLPSESSLYFFWTLTAGLHAVCALNTWLELISRLLDSCAVLHWKDVFTLDDEPVPEPFEWNMLVQLWGLVHLKFIHFVTLKAPFRWSCHRAQTFITDLPRWTTQLVRWLPDVPLVNKSENPVVAADKICGPKTHCLKLNSGH